MAQTAAEAQLVAGRLNAIQARVDAVTEGQWVVADTTDPESEWHDDYDSPMVVTDDSTPSMYTSIAEEFHQGSDNGRADATFVASAPEDIRWLLKLVSSLHDQLDKKE